MAPPLATARQVTRQPPPTGSCEKSGLAQLTVGERLLAGAERGRLPRRWRRHRLQGSACGIISRHSKHLGYSLRVDFLAKGSSPLRAWRRWEQQFNSRVGAFPRAHGSEADDVRHEGVGRLEPDAADRRRTLAVAIRPAKPVSSINTTDPNLRAHAVTSGFIGRGRTPAVTTPVRKGSFLTKNLRKANGHMLSLDEWIGRR